MNIDMEKLMQAVQSGAKGLGSALAGTGRGLRAGFARSGRSLMALGIIAATGYAIANHPPLDVLEHGEVGIRTNRWLGGSQHFSEGPVMVLPGVHDLRRYSLKDRVFHPTRSMEASGSAPFQSVEGLSIGVDLNVRYALDPAQLTRIAAQLPEDIDSEIVGPAVEGVIYKVFSRYTVKEIFTSKRPEIQQLIESELKKPLSDDGILLKSVQVGRVDLPSEYRAGMERLLAEELENEKMRYTLVLRDQQVKQTALEAEADKVRRDKAAEAAGNEQVIAARAQAEAMKHVLPFKEKQIEQRRLEAEADKLERISTAEASASARRIEAAGEADSRQKLADAEAYRMEQIARVNSAQMERDGALLSKHPLLIQKAMADKLSDKISVIIAPPPASGGFIGSTLVGSAAGVQGAP